MSGSSLRKANTGFDSPESLSLYYLDPHPLLLEVTGEPKKCNPLPLAEPIAQRLDGMPALIRVLPYKILQHETHTITVTTPTEANCLYWHVSITGGGK